MTATAPRSADAPQPVLEGVVCASLSVSTLVKGDRRLEGEAYLTGGYRFRLAIESSGRPFSRLGDVAHVWQPSRLKGVVVPRERGVPFLTTNQIFDIDPRVRKWLAPSQVPDLEKRYVKSGWILITCSGNGMNNNVGKVFASYSLHEDKIISHDLLRVQAHDQRDFGSLYAFLRSKYGRSMLRSSQYGSAIKHLEPEHAEQIPVPSIQPELRDDLAASITSVFSRRDESYRLLTEASAQFARKVGPRLQLPADEAPYTAAAKDLGRGARRLDAYHHNPSARMVLRVLEEAGRPISLLGDLTERIFLPNRFARVLGADGIPYLDSEDVFKVNPDILKFIPPAAKRDAIAYQVKKGWILLARSGQIYGINGTPVLAGTWHQDKIVSEDLIRVIPNHKVRGGYLQVAMGHPVLGRPLILRWAFGSGVPHIAPGDLASFPIVRLGDAEDAIADMVDRAGRLREEADALEDEAVAMIEAEVEHGLGVSASC